MALLHARNVQREGDIHYVQAVENHNCNNTITAKTISSDMCSTQAQGEKVPSQGEL